MLYGRAAPVIGNRSYVTAYLAGQPTVVISQLPLWWQDALLDGLPRGALGYS